MLRISVFKIKFIKAILKRLIVVCVHHSTYITNWKIFRATNIYFYKNSLHIKSLHSQAARLIISATRECKNNQKTHTHTHTCTNMCIRNKFLSRQNIYLRSLEAFMLSNKFPHT